MRRIPVFFAEARVMRPSVGSLARSESPSGYAAMPRQEVSERIGLGRSSCASMPSGGPLREVSMAEAIGPWPVKPRLAQAAHSPMATFGVARSRVMLEGRAKQKPSAAERTAEPSAMREPSAMGDKP